MTRAEYVRLALALVAVATVGAVVIWLFGDRGLDVLFVLVLAWLLCDRAGLGERVDQALDDADLAIGRIEAVECHLAGLEPLSSGRLASGQGPTYPWPRHSLTGWPPPPAPHA